MTIEGCGFTVAGAGLAAYIVSSLCFGAGLFDLLLVYALGCVLLLIVDVWYLVALSHAFAGLTRVLVVCVLLGWFGRFIGYCVLVAACIVVCL